MEINRNEYNYFLKNILDAIEQSTGIYSNDAFKVVAIASLELMWDKLDVDCHFHNYDPTKQDYYDYFEKRADKAKVKKYLYWVMFEMEKENEDEREK